MAYRTDLLYNVECLGDAAVGIAPLERFGDRKGEPYDTHVCVSHGFFRAAYIGHDGEELRNTCLLDERTTQQIQYLSRIPHLGDGFGRYETTEIKPIEPDIEQPLHIGGFGGRGNEAVYALHRIAAAFRNRHHRANRFPW